MKKTPIIVAVVAIGLSGAWLIGQNTAPIPAQGDESTPVIQITAEPTASPTPEIGEPVTIENDTPDITVNPCGAQPVPNTVPGVCYDNGTIQPAPEEPIQEDDPRWDCTTMGNRICGPDASPVHVTDGTIWPCVVWATSEQIIPQGVRDDVCVTTDGNYSFPFDN